MRTGGEGGARDEGSKNSPRSPSDLVDRLALLVLLALIPIRAVAAETHSFETPSFLRHLDVPPGAQPATTFTLAGVIAGVALLLACARLAWGSRRYQWTGAELGGVVLLAAGAISISRAGQKHLALIGVIDFLAMVVYLFALRQVLVRPWRIRLALIVVLTTGAVVIVKCASQHFWEFPATVQEYEKMKQEWIDRPAGDFRTHQRGLEHDFERRLMAQTISGYYQHPNLLGSHLILIIMAALAVIAEKVRRSRTIWTLIPPGLIALGAVVAMVGAQSKGAIAAYCIGAVIWILGHVVGGVIRRYPRLFAVGLWIGAIGGAAMLIHVLRPEPHDALGRSMQFRYMYWQGARNMIANLGQLGVGPNNFGRHFSKYKPIECPEDVESPHSWPVQFAAEWGAIGLAGIICQVVGLSFALAGRSKRVNSAVASNKNDPPGSIILWCGGIGALLLVAWLCVLSGTQVDALALTLFVGGMPFVIWFVLLSVESQETTQVVDDAPGPLLPGLCGALFAFLLHSGIDLALFAGGPATTFFALAAVALAVRQSGRAMGANVATASRSVPRFGEYEGKPLAVRGGVFRVVAMMVAVIGGVLLVGYCVMLVHPAAKLADNLYVGRVSEKPADWAAYADSKSGRAYMAGLLAYKLDGAAADELIDELLPRVASVEQVDDALGVAQEFRLRDPNSAVGYHHLAALYHRRYLFGRDLGDFQRAIQWCREYVAAYPSSPDRRINLGYLLEDFAGATGDAQARLDAADQLEAALEFDAKRIYVSKPNRLTDDERAALRERIERLGKGSRAEGE